MRLICPNCGAQYEVDDRIIPETGRDVQCSACSHGWFFVPPDQQAAGIAAPSPLEDNNDPIDESVHGDTHDKDPQFDVTATSSQTRRQLDDNVREILREEAERELTARSTDQQHIETQADLGLDTMSDTPPGTHAASRSGAARTPDDALCETRTETPLAETPQDEMVDDPQRPSLSKGREALPDIEEINSTLDAPETDTKGATDAVITSPQTKSGGFRRGFVSVVVLACLLAIVYIMAPEIGEHVPALQPYLEQYISIADQVRLWLEDTTRMAVSKMQNLIDTPGGG